MLAHQIITVATLRIILADVGESPPANGALVGLTEHPGARQLLAEGLERLERRLPEPGRDLAGETMLVGRSRAQAASGAAAAGLLDLDTEDRLQTWRYGFSMARVSFDAWRTQLRIDRELAAAAALDWPSRQAAVRGITARCLASPNPLVRVLLASLHAAPAPWLEVCAQVRMLRELCAWRETGAVHALADPFAAGDAPLQARVEADGGLLLWSVGQDGKGLGANNPLQARARPVEPAVPVGGR